MDVLKEAKQIKDFIQDSSIGTVAGAPFQNRVNLTVNSQQSLNERISILESRVNSLENYVNSSENEVRKALTELFAKVG